MVPCWHNQIQVLICRKSNTGDAGRQVFLTSAVQPVAPLALFISFLSFFPIKLGENRLSWWLF